MIYKRSQTPLNGSSFNMEEHLERSSLSSSTVQIDQMMLCCHLLPAQFRHKEMTSSFAMSSFASCPIRMLFMGSQSNNSAKLLLGFT